MRSQRRCKLVGRQRRRRAFAKCVIRIRRLAEMGHELRRPEADLLRDGIYELRGRDGRVNYRILYFFHGHNIAILANALTKEDKVPKSDIEREVGHQFHPKVDFRIDRRTAQTVGIAGSGQLPHERRVQDTIDLTQ